MKAKLKTQKKSNVWAYMLVMLFFGFKPEKQGQTFKASDLILFKVKPT